MYPQQTRLLDYLKNRQGGASTLEIIRETDILRPANRVQELRELGFKIVTNWTFEHTGKGLHRVAKYVLLH